MADQHHSNRLGQEFRDGMNDAEAARQGLFDGINKTQSNLTGVRRYAYLTLIFLGIIMIWRGLLSLLDAIPLLSNPIVSLVLGFLILRYTGDVFGKLLGGGKS